MQPRCFLNAGASVLEPHLSDPDRTELIDTCLASVLALPPPDPAKERDENGGDALPKEVRNPGWAAPRGANAGQGHRVLFRWAVAALGCWFHSPVSWGGVCRGSLCVPGSRAAVGKACFN